MKRPPKKIVLLSLAAAALAAAAVWLLLRPPEELRLRRRYAELEERLSCPADAGAVARTGKARQGRHFLMDRCRLSAPPWRSDEISREEASKLLMRIYSSFRELKIRFSDFESITVRGNRAEVRCTLQAGGHVGADEWDEVRLLHCTLQKVRGEWLFAEIQAEEVIRR